MPDNRKLRVFLCHSSQDKPIVRELYQRLLAEGWIDPWLDTAKLLPGQHWSIVIKQAIDIADLVVVFISKNSINKEGFLQREMNYVWDRSLEKPRNIIFMIPLRVEDCDVPYDLREKQWVDYFGAKKELTYSALLQSMELRRRQVIDSVSDSLQISGSPNKQIESEMAITNGDLIDMTSKSLSTGSSKIVPPVFSVSFLQSTISVETLGGVATPIFYKGDSLPLKTNILFSTAANNQIAVEIHLVLGENKLVSDNVSLGKFFLDGIPLAPRGVPKVDVQFEIDQDLVLSVTATEEITGNTKKMPIIMLSKIIPPPVKDRLPPKMENAHARNIFSAGSFGNFISSFFSGNDRASSGAKLGNLNRDYDLQTTLNVSFEDAALGSECEVEIDRYDTCVECNGSGVVYALPCLKCNGEGNSLEKFSFRVVIPAGVFSGANIKFSGAGHVRPDNSRGDVYALISVGEHPFFSREDSDLYIKYPIPKRFAIQGGDLQIPLLTKGDFILLKIPPNTKEKQVFRIPSRGIPKLKTPTEFGDLYITVETYDPKKIPSNVKMVITSINSHLRK